jgi:PPOX class probable F420-dependent enzyme
VLAKSKAPQRPPLSQDKIATFLAGKRNAILATIKKDGSPQLTPVWYRWDGEQFWVSITKERAKYKNILRDPRVSLCVDDAEHVTTVIASGKARLTEENLWADTQKIVERYRGPEQGTAYVQSMQEQKEPRVLLVFKPEKVISWGG